MSLLLEALKKAELAKQGAQGEQEADPAPAESTPFPTVELTLEESEPAPVHAEPVQPRTPVITRESLPDISQPLEIRTEDLSERRAEEPRMQAPEPPPPPRPAPERRSEPARGSFAAVEPADAPAQRDAARQMFEVKEIEYNPKRPFYLTIGGLITAGVCYGVYVWWQMQPHYSVNTAAVQNAPKGPPPPLPAARAPAPADTATATPEPAPAPVPPAVAAAKAPATPPSAAPVRRTASGESQEGEPKPIPAGPVFTATQAAPARASRTTGSSATRPARTAEAAGPIAVTPPRAEIDPVLERGFGAYQSGNLDAARSEYQRVLEREPANRDALLGLAAIDVRTRSFETAELRYLKLLEINPRDTHAHAGLIALQGSVDPVQSESRIKTLIAGQPEATHLYFTLGNVYAAQSRWAEAQDAFFRAYSADSNNADYAFNLAVSLDQLRQKKQAAEYYRRAAALAAGRPAAFDRARADARAGELER